ncbi:phage major capsid protein, P2 family [Curvibacter gracilis]|uniref:phage major capsid protein, P2 family n=1 Tax=Curvibacter gracilis TaxID=230310 RepID=UPI0004882C2B|nr:phage major capsid protein, P2 family [Curvibacter gracilis]
MRNETRQAYAELLNQIGRLNAVADATKQFTVSPSVQQKLESKIQESSDFLGRINISPVVEMQGDKLGLGVSGPAASRTDTTTKDRQTRDISTLDSRGYQCVKTNSDTHITYAKLDAWAKFPDFQTRVRDLIVRRQALDRILIGWNGTSIAADTDLVAHPLLQDVNKGWLQHLRDDAPSRVMSGGKTAGQIKIGVGAANDYQNLDALVFDAINGLDPWYQQDPGLVVLMGRNLLTEKYFPLVDVSQVPTETLAADIVISQKRVGGLQAATVPYFPDNKLLITTYDNLSIYWQEGARRRRMEENAKRDRIENYESSNDAYVVEDLGRAVMAENITFTD